MGESGRLFLEKQFTRAMCSFHYGFDERHAELSFLEFHDAVNGASGRRGYRIFE